MNWYGLNWTDIVINVIVLAILPGLLGALGGHLAAEGLQEEKRRRSIKVIFWAMCIVWVLVTFWQQFRAAEADLDRANKDVWAQALATSKFLPPPPPANIERGKTQEVPRSYVSIASACRFGTRTDKNGKPLEDQHFQVGDELFFNVYFSPSGPNPVELVRNDSRLYVETASGLDAQEALIADFKSRIHKRETVHIPAEPPTMMRGEDGFFTAYAFTDSGEHKKVTQDDLDQFRAGTKISFVVAQITYRDRGVVHHARRCLWLQPPADPPGIWQMCGGFNKSD